MKRYKCLVAGVGNPHIFHYLPYDEKQVQRLEVLAVSESNPELLEFGKRLHAWNTSARFYSDYREMLANHPDAEMILIGSDNVYHAEIFREAVKHNLHIYMMKVISMDEAECREMLELEKTYNRVIGCELELHFRRQFIQARELVRAGKIGEIKSIYLSNLSLSPICRFPNWGTPELIYGKRIPIHPGDSIYRGGAITDHPHPYDVVRWITGHEFRTVYAISGRNQRNYLQVEDHAVLTGELDNGISYMINPSYCNLEENSPDVRMIWPKTLECNLKITGTKGVIETDFFDRHSLVCGPYYAPNRTLLEHVPDVNNPRNPDMMSAYLDVLDGKRDRVETSLRDDYEAVRVMNAAYDSIYTGKEITLEVAK